MWEMCWLQILQEVIGQLHDQMKAAADLVSGIGAYIPPVG